MSTLPDRRCEVARKLTKAEQALRTKAKCATSVFVGAANAGAADEVKKINWEHIPECAVCQAAEQQKAMTEASETAAPYADQLMFSWISDQEAAEDACLA